MNKEQSDKRDALELASYLENSAEVGSDVALTEADKRFCAKALRGFYVSRQTLDAEAVSWALGKLEAFGLQTKTESALMMDRLKLMLLESIPSHVERITPAELEHLIEWHDACAKFSSQSDNFSGETHHEARAAALRKVDELWCDIGARSAPSTTLGCDVCEAEPGRCMTATICQQVREARNARSATPYSHVICFEGEGAEVLLCRGWDDCREQFFNGIFGDGHHDWDEAQVRLWDADFANDDSWSRDENGKRYRFTADVGEISKVRIYAINAADGGKQTTKEKS